MNIKLKQKVLSLLVLPVAIFGLIAGAAGVFAEEPTGTTKYPLYLTMDIKTDPKFGHIKPGVSNGKFLGDIAQYQSMWENLKITIEDKDGKRELGKELDSSARKKVGDYAKGEKIMVTVDVDGIPDNFHLSNMRITPKEDGIAGPGGGQLKYYRYPEIGHYNKFELTFTPNNANNEATCMNAVIALSCHMYVKFDLQGGNIKGDTKPIQTIVNKDNSVNFPADPTKANLSFGGWYTQRPYKYGKRTMPEGYGGTIDYWTKDDGFSDYNRDWKIWNEEEVDPIYDNIFLLRAYWKAKVSFDTDGGGAIDPVEVKEGEKVAAPATAPKKKFAEFKGWQKDGSDYDFESPVMGNMTLKAKWDEYTLAKTQDQTITVGDSFNAEDGIINKDKLPQGTTLSPVGELDINTVGTKNVKVLVKYPNGDEQEVEYKLTVKAKEEAKPEPKPEDGKPENGGIKTEDNNTKSQQVGTAPNTGDNIDLRLYASLMAMSGAIMIAATAAFARAKSEK